MNIPRRLEVLRRLGEALEQITPANGYQHDLTDTVFRGRATFGEGDPLPMVSILEVPLQPDQLKPPEPGSTNRGGWELVLQGFCEDDKKNPTDPAYMLLADVQKKLAEIKEQNEDYNILGPWANTPGKKSPITDMEIGQGVVRPPDEVSYKAYFWLTLTQQLVDDLSDPYTF